MRLLYLFILLLSIPVFGQFVTYNLDRQLVYEFDDEHRTSYFYNSDDAKQLVYLQGEKTLEQKGATIFAITENHHKIFELQGGFVNNYYFINGYSERERSFQTGGRSYELSDEVFTWESYSNCKMLEVTASDGLIIRLYFSNRKDNEDYSSITNSILQQYSMPEITNFKRLLGDGWVMIYGEIVNKADSHYPFIGTLRPDKEKYAKKIQFSQKQMEYYLDTTGKYDEYIIDYPIPVYCEVFAVNGDVDEKTYDQINYFLKGMCTYFDYFGRYNLKEFQEYYQREMNDKVNEFKNDKTLNSRQIEKFIAEIQSYAPFNEKSKLEAGD